MDNKMKGRIKISIYANSASDDGGYRNHQRIGDHRSEFPGCVPDDDPESYFDPMFAIIPTTIIVGN